MTFSSATLPGGDYEKLRVEGKDVTATLDEDSGGVYRFKLVELEDGAVMKIQGKVDVMIEESLYIDDGATIILADDASMVRFYVGGNVTVKSGAIGIPPAVAQSGDIKVEDLDGYIHPKRIRLYSFPTIDGGDDMALVIVQDASVILLNMITPSKKVAILRDSTVIGRLTGSDVMLSHGARLFYDPILDNKMGYTVFNGPMYKNNGDPQDGLMTGLSTYDPMQGLDQFKAHMMGHIFEEVDAVPFVPPGDPDPRNADRAVEKPWPFVAMAIEEGNYVAGDNDERQESLYVPLDDTNFDVDQFYNDGLIIATYTKTSNVVEDVVEDVVDVVEDIGDGVGGLLGGVGGLLGG